MRSLRRSAARVIALSLALSLALMALGCAASRGPAPEALSESGEAMDLAQSLYERGLSSPTFAARGGLTLVDGGSTRYFKFELITSRPDKLSLTILDPFGRPALKAVSDGQRLAALDYGDRLAAVGQASDSALGRILPVGLSPEILLAVLSYAPILRPDQAAASRGPGGEMLALLIATHSLSGDVNWSMALAPGEGAPKITAISAKAQPGFPALSVAYGTFKPVDEEDQGISREFPHLVEAVLGDGRKLTVRYDEVRLGAPIPTEVFETAAPEGFLVEPI